MFYIKDAAEHIGKKVTVKGWLYNKRSSGKIHFLILRDGTGIMQAVMVQGNVDDEIFNKYDEFTQETSLTVTGVVRHDERAPGNYEMDVDDLQIIQIAADDYPITPKDHGIAYLMDHRHLWLRSSQQYAILSIRDEFCKGIRDFFYDRGFKLLDTPILTGAIGETESTLFETEYFDHGKAYLAQTGQLYSEATIYAFNKVYCFGPTFRAEKSKTRRHLTEFWMVEAEEAFYDNDMNMDLQEEFVSCLVQRVLANCQEHLEALERDTAKLELVKPPFPRITYAEAIKLLQEKGSAIKYGEDFGGDDETILTEQFDRPVFVYDWPKRAKAFYMKEHPENPELVRCSDLLAPEGYGEIIGGSQREDDYDKLLARIHDEGLPKDAYGWYLDLRKYGSVEHSGFGLGVERTVTWICGTQHVRTAIPFPRTLKRIYP